LTPIVAAKVIIGGGTWKNIIPNPALKRRTKILPLRSDGKISFFPSLPPDAHPARSADRQENYWPWPATTRL
jgi:hypothetical protein